MQTNIHAEGLKLSDSQKDYLQDKIESLTKYKMVEDESAMAKIDVIYHKSKISDQDYKVSVTLEVPRHNLHAETFCKTIEEGADLVEEKLRHQLEKLKDK